MKELSLHILDLAENSIDAEAKLLKITIKELLKEDKLIIIIEDDGKGMDEDFLSKVTNPFVTTRKTRGVGFGLSLMKASSERCEGTFKIDSKKNVGTKLKASFKHSHIDRAPLGKIEETITTLINNNKDIDIVYRHIVNTNEFVLDTRKVKEMLEDVDINNADILLWIRDYIKENLKELYL
ncbi:MAG: ATP-binding protein [Firmicutes bacterium]|nr:ATP-binding protein [Bacillota bacterium]